MAAVGYVLPAQTAGQANSAVRMETRGQANKATKPAVVCAPLTQPAGQIKDALA